MKNLSFLEKIFLLIYAAFSVFFFFLFVYKCFLGQEICHSQGCSLAHQLAIINDKYFYFLGSIYFFVYIILSLLNQAYHRYLFSFFVFFSESILIARQLIDYKVLCQICAAFYFLVFLGYIYAAKKEKIEFKHLFSQLLILLAIYFAMSMTMNRFGDRYSEFILYYSKNCSHCQRVISYIKEKNLDHKIKLVEKNKAMTLLYGLGINEIPILKIRENQNIIFIIGEKNIKKYINEKFIEKRKKININEFLNEIPVGICTEAGCH